MADEAKSNEYQRSWGSTREYKKELSEKLHKSEDDSKSGDNRATPAPAPSGPTVDKPKDGNKNDSRP